MVLVWLRGLREFRTKFAQPPTLFPPRQPRVRKTKPQSVRTLHERSSKISKYISTISKLNVKRFWATFGVIIMGWRAISLVAENFGGFVPILSRALTCRHWFSFHYLPKLGSCLSVSWLLALIPWLLLSKFTFCGAVEALVTLFTRAGRPSLYLSGALWASHLRSFAELKPFHLFGGHHLGSVD
jgi:hypothetical protein